MKYLSRRDFLILPLSITLGAALASLQPGNWFIGWLGFSFLFLLSLSLLILSTKWADGGLDTFLEKRSGLFDHQKILVWLVALAFILRFAGGVATYLALPVNGFDDEDDRAGYVFTDAHRRDTQAWELANSEHPILDAFNKNYAYDQYGGLLAFSALVYRYLSPDAHRPLMLVLISAWIAALALPFLWKAVGQLWEERIALASSLVFAFYPESLLLGGSAMREPYLMTFSAMALWGFADWQVNHNVRSVWLWIGIGLAGMLMVSPVLALVTILIFAGWIYFTSEHGRIPWWVLLVLVLVFAGGLFLLSEALNRQGNLEGVTPVGVIGSFMREAVKWDVYQLERGSGWVQKLFDEMPEWLRLPFVMVYGVFQPVLPAAFVEPTTLTWRIIGILRAVGWYALLPVLTLSFVAAAGRGRRPERVEGSGKTRNLWMWFTLLCWTWILLAALRGGGDQWDNPRYRAILFFWQAILAGHTIVWWRETRSPWFMRIVACEIVFLLVFTQWYASRYFHWGGQLPFAGMIFIILGLWVLILAGGWWFARKRA